MLILHIPDVAGNNTVKSIASLFTAAGVTLPPGNKVKWVRIVEISAGTTNTRVGNASVSNTNGMTLNVSADGLYLPAVAGYADDSLYDLNQIYLYHATGDTISISVGVWDFDKTPVPYKK
jgi:hypothetical protein